MLRRHILSLVLALLVFTAPAHSAITFFASSSSPTDNAALDGAAARAVTPPANMLSGDLVYLIAMVRNVNQSLAIDTTGGQSWSAETELAVGGSGRVRVFHARFNGTWSTDPAVATTSATNSGLTVVMLVFRPTSGTNTWTVNVAQANSSFDVPVSPFNVTASGQTTTAASTVTIAAFTSVDNNAWALQSSGWINPAGTTQFRNTTGSGSSVSLAYKIQSAAGATGDITNQQTALGGDAGRWLMQSFAEVATSDTEAPSVPSNLTATAASSSQINLSWTASTDNVAVSEYRIERCAGAACTDFAQVATSSTASYSNTGLSASTTYRYRVRAQDAATNVSAYSSIAEAATSAAPDTQAPSTPSGLSATAASSSQINLSWSASTDNVAVTGYLLERCTGASCTDFSQIGSPSAISFNDTGLSASTTYRYRVRATDAATNFSDYSSLVSATTAGTAPSAIAFFASASTPADNGELDGSVARAVTPPANMVPGDLVYLIAMVRNLNYTLTVDTPGGQSWTAETQQPVQGSGQMRVFHTRFNGTWTADPAVATSGSTGSGLTVAMLVFRPTNASNTWAVNVAQATTSFSAPVSPFDVTASGQTTTAASTVTIAAFATPDDNTWALQSAGWANPAGLTQFRNLAGSDSSVSLAYKIQTTAGATGSLTNQQTANGGDSGRWVMQTFAEVANTDTQAPTAPATLSATATSSTQINLSWTASTDNVGVTEYRIERCAGASCTNFAQVGTATSASYSDSTLTASTTYRYQVRAGDAATNLSAYSSIASATTQASGGGGDTQAPTAPTGLAATAISSSQINLSWSASTDNVAVSGYLLERCAGASCTDFTQIDTPSGTSASNTGLAASTTYRYRIRATDAANNLSGYSSIVSATTQAAADTQAPTVPSALTAAATSVSQITLSWGASTDNVGVTAYLLERCEGAGCTSFAQIASQSALTYIDTGLSASSTYRYRVRAQDAATNQSGYSSIASDSTQSSSGAAANIEYIYDDLGRLVQATDTTVGQAIVYSYDAASNITSVQNKSTSAPVISNFTPTQGPVGSTVLIHGMGFSATAANNTVRFNGTTATVSAASARELTVTVPPGATTGAISVTVGTSTATSAQPFSVTGAGSAPSIASFSPAMAAVGAAVTISGVNFETTTLSNRLRIGSTSAQVNTATATTLSTTVPAGAGSGKIRLTTPRGIAVSSTDFIVVPSGYSASSIASSGRVTVDASPTSISLATANKVSVQLFEGSAGDLLTISVSALTLPSCTIKVFTPDGTQLVTGTVTAAGQGVQLPKLPATGTYSIVLDPGANTGSAAIAVLGPITGTFTVGGSPTALNLTPAGRRAKLTFTGTAGAYVSLALSSVTLANGTASILSPDGSILVTAPFTSNGLTLAPQLPASGNYSVLIEPTGSITGTLSVGIATTASAVLGINQSPYSLSVSTADPISVTFRGEANQYLAIAVEESLGTNSSISGATLKILSPDGSQLVSVPFTATTCTNCGGYSGNKLINIGPLAIGGTYTLVVVRTSGGSGTLAITLSTPLTGSLTANGTTTPFQVTSAGQGMKLSFSGTSGQYMSVAVEENLGTSSHIAAATLIVLNPDGSQLASKPFTAVTCANCGGYSGNEVINLGPLATTGTYTLLIQQADARKGKLDITLLTPLTGSLTPNGTATPFQISGAGRGMMLSFSGTAGQYLSLALTEFIGSGSSIPGATLTVLSPDGAQLASSPFTATTCANCNGYSGSAVVNLGPLAVAGTYTFLVQQTDARTGTLNVTLSTPLTGSLVANGTVTSFQVTSTGQGLELTFAATAAQYVTLAVVENGSTGDSITGANITVLKPDGSTLTSAVLIAATCGGCSGRWSGNVTVSMGPLPVSGTYKVLVQQTTANSGTLRITLSTPLTGSLTANGTVTPFQVTSAGQGMELTFAGAAAQYLELAVVESGTSSDKITGANIKVLKPDGSTLTSAVLTAATCGACGGAWSGNVTLNMGPLPVSGTYTVLVQQTSAGTGTLRFQLSTQ